MKTFDVICKIVIALAAIAGLVFVVIKYGDKIVSWFEGLFCKKPGCVVDSVVVEEEAAADPDQACEEDFENC